MLVSLGVVATVLAQSSPVTRIGTTGMEKVLLIGSDTGPGVRVMGGPGVGFVELAMLDSAGNPCATIAAGNNGVSFVRLQNSQGRPVTQIGVFSVDGLPGLALYDPRTGEEVWSVRVLPEGGVAQAFLGPADITRPVSAVPVPSGTPVRVPRDEPNTP